MPGDRLRLLGNFCRPARRRGMTLHVRFARAISVPFRAMVSQLHRSAFRAAASSPSHGRPPALKGDASAAMFILTAVVGTRCSTWINSTANPPISRLTPKSISVMAHFRMKFSGPTRLHLTDTRIDGSRARNRGSAPVEGRSLDARWHLTRKRCRSTSWQL